MKVCRTSKAFILAMVRSTSPIVYKLLVLIHRILLRILKNKYPYGMVAYGIILIKQSMII